MNGPVIHQHSPTRKDGTRCGASRYRVKNSANQDKVTCLRCLASIRLEKEREEKYAKR